MKAKMSKADARYTPKASMKSEECVKCRSYEHPSRANSMCTKVGDTPTDTVYHLGWCRLFKPRKDSK